MSTGLEVAPSDPNQSRVDVKTSGASSFAFDAIDGLFVAATGMLGLVVALLICCLSNCLSDPKNICSDRISCTTNLMTIFMSCIIPFISLFKLVIRGKNFDAFCHRSCLCGKFERVDYV